MAEANGLDHTRAEIPPCEWQLKTPPELVLRGSHQLVESLNQGNSTTKVAEGVKFFCRGSGKGVWRSGRGRHSDPLPPAGESESRAP
jgi:hypothetical protein